MNLEWWLVGYRIGWWVGRLVGWLVRYRWFVLVVVALGAGVLALVVLLGGGGPGVPVKPALPAPVVTAASLEGCLRAAEVAVATLEIRAGWVEDRQVVLAEMVGSVVARCSGAADLRACLEAWVVEVGRVKVNP